MKLGISLVERSYKSYIVDGKDYGYFALKEDSRITSSNFSSEKVKAILHYLNTNKKRFSGTKVGNHYYKKTFVSVSTELDRIDVFLTFCKVDEVENHKEAFNELPDIQIVI